MKRPYIDDAEDHISDAAVMSSAVKRIPAGALLFVVRGMILAHSFPTALTTREVTVNQDMKALVLSLPTLGEYLLRTCQGARKRMLDRVERSSHGTCRLDSEDVELFPIPLPPLAEQKRIVAKLDELMKLCDDLEARQAKQRETADRLNKAALGALTSAEGPEDLAASWRRVARSFDALLNRPESIKELRASVLELAVRGRLIPQEDRPSRSPHQTDKELFSVPSIWTWARIEDEFDVVGGIQKTPHRAPRSRHFPYLRVENVQRGRLDLERIERFELERNELERWRLLPEDILVVEGNGSATEIGRCAIWNGAIENCVHQNHIIRCRPVGAVSSPFALLFLNSPTGMTEMRQLAITTSGLYSLSVGKIRGIILPVPPLAEQKCIVAKVDELMKLCDALENALRRAEGTAKNLADAIVAELLA